MICGLSGGVDRAVAAVLIHHAIGDQLTCIFVDNGLLRLNEAEQVVSLFRRHFNIPLVHVGCEPNDFWRRLRGVTDPEAKRKTIGGAVHRRVRSGGEEARRRRVPGTGHALSRRHRERSFTGGPSVTIKTHHNVGGLPERMNLKLVEPLRELFKDEVRALGRELGLPERFHRAPTVSRARPGDPHAGRDNPRQARNIAPSGCGRPGRDPQGWLVRRRSGRRLPCCYRYAPWA